MTRAIKQYLLDKLIFRFSRMDRVGLSGFFIKGEGIEIGAMDLPLKVKSGVQVKYLDRISKEESEKIFPSLKGKLVKVDIISNGETLANITSSSQDFVICNHFIEHTENPIQTLQNIFRVLKPKGQIFMAIPDKRFTFDMDRAITSLDHHIRDFKEGAEWSHHDHYFDFAKHTEHGHGKSDAEIVEVIRNLKAVNWSIHFHVWDHQAMLDMLSMMKSQLNFNFEIEAAIAPLPGGHESIFVLQKP